MIPAVDIACLALGAAGASVGLAAAMRLICVAAHNRTLTERVGGYLKLRDVWEGQAMALARELDARIAKEDADKALRKASASHARQRQLDQERQRKAETTAQLQREVRR